MLFIDLAISTVVVRFHAISANSTVHSNPATAMESGVMRRPALSEAMGHTVPLASFFHAVPFHQTGSGMVVSQ